MNSPRSGRTARPGIRHSREVRRSAVAMLVVVAVIIPVIAMVAGGGGGATNTPSPGTGCDHWCGNGWAKVTAGPTTVTVDGGGCFDQGALGVDARFGDWQGVAGTSSYVSLTFYRPGGATPTPAIAGATPEHPPIPVNGSMSGSPFVLGPDAVVVVNADGTGSFSGADINDGHAVSGTFYCG
jgi:hypothetical protein